MFNFLHRMIQVIGFITIIFVSLAYVRGCMLAADMQKMVDDVELIE